MSRVWDMGKGGRESDLGGSEGFSPSKNNRNVEAIRPGLSGNAVCPHSNL
jgi:hypothetical protein